MRRSPEALSEEDFDLVFSINVRSLLMLSIGLAEPMKRRGEGIDRQHFVCSELAWSFGSRRICRYEGRSRCDDTSARY